MQLEVLKEKYRKAIPENCSLTEQDHYNSGFCESIFNHIQFLSKINCENCEYSLLNRVAL